MERILSANLHNRKKKMQKPTSSPLPPSLEKIDAAPLQHRGIFGGIVRQQKADPAQTAGPSILDLRRRQI